MNELLFSLGALMGAYSESEYYNLEEEEKANVDFVNERLFSDNRHISDAAFYIMLLILEIGNEPDKYEPEVVHDKFEEILKDLTAEERSMMNGYALACINTMGIYNEENKKQRRLRKGEDLNDKS